MQRTIAFISCLLFSFMGLVLSVESNAFVRKIENGGYLWLGIPASDGSYVTASFFEGNGLAVRKINVSGEILWARKLGVVAEEFSNISYLNLNGIIETTNHGFVLIGESQCEECSERLSFIIKLDGEGRLKWKKGFSNGFADNFHFDSVHSIPDGGFIIAAETTESKSLIRFTSTGDVLWKKSFSLDSNQFLLESLSTSDNGLVLFYGVVGGIQIIKFDYSGNSVWSRKLEIPSFSGYYATAGSTHNGFVIAGSTGNLFLIGLREDGTLAWKKAYSTGVRDFPYLTSVRQSSDKGLIVTAILGDSSLFLKVDSSRNIVSQNLFPDMFGDFFIARSTIDTADGFMVFGNSAFDDGVDGLIPLDDQFILKLDSNARSANCISQAPANLTPVAFPFVKVLPGPKLNSTNSITLHEKTFKVTSIFSPTRTFRVCSSQNN